MQLFHVPIEPYETRYTADWIEQYETEFKNNNIQFKTILGKQTTSKLKEGTVLDCCGTNIYKSSQMISLMKTVLSVLVLKSKMMILFSLQICGFPVLKHCFM